MTDLMPPPRFEVEDRYSPRLEALPVPVPPVAPTRGAAIATLAVSGLAVLLAGLAGLGVANFVIDQFARGPVLGWLTLAVVASGAGLIGLALWREVAGLFALGRVDRMRARLADPATTIRAAQDWLAGLPEGAALSSAIAAADDPQATLALLRAGPVATLRGQAEARARDAALQIFAITAAIPSPELDGLLVAWRGARLVREVASLHGLRPGLLGTLALLRRTLLSAAAVATTNLATDTATRAVLSNPVLGHLAGDVAGAGVAARRMFVLARAAAVACCPVPPAA